MFVSLWFYSSPAETQDSETNGYGYTKCNREKPTQCFKITAQSKMI